MANAQSATVVDETESGLVLELPDTASSRRVSGVYGNELAQQFPERAHVILTKKSCGNYLVSVRAPLSNRTGADTLCLQFDTGGGRSAATGRALRRGDQADCGHRQDDSDRHARCRGGHGLDGRRSVQRIDGG